MNSDIVDSQDERDFRERDASELRKKKIISGSSSYFGTDEISDELAKVKHQAMITPGRRGEQIKHEEISKEILRRISIGSNRTQRK